MGASVRFLTSAQGLHLASPGLFPVCWGKCGKERRKIRQEYHVTLYSQMGPREGRLVLQYEGSAVTGSLELMGRRNPVHGVRSEDGHLCLSHAIRTAVSTLFCETALELHGERLTGVTTADVCRMRWEGSRISPEP